MLPRIFTHEELSSADNNSDNRMHSVLHIERRDAAPGTPTSSHLWDSQSPRSASRSHQTSNKRLSLSALKSPFKSLRLRRKSHTPVGQSPTSAKRNQSLFCLFHSSRSRARESTEALKGGIATEGSKTVSPSRNRAGDSESRYVTHSGDCDIE